MSDHPHILTNFDDALRDLQSRVASFGPRMIANLESCESALFNRQVSGISETIVEAGDFQEDADAVGHLSREVLLRFRPVANDLRFVLARVRVSATLGSLAGELEEIGRRVRNFVTSLNERSDDATTATVERLRPLFEMARHEFRDAMDALETQNTELASSVRRRDAELDELHRQLMDILVKFAAEDDTDSNEGSHWLVHGVFLIRALERVGDLAKNIADEVLFLETAQVEGHTHETD